MKIAWMEVWQSGHDVGTRCSCAEIWVPSRLVAFILISEDFRGIVKIGKPVLRMTAISLGQKESFRILEKAGVHGTARAF